MTTNEDRFTRKALERWRQIPQPIQFRLLNNVYCAPCQGAVGMLGHRGRVEDGLLVLEGSCGTCGEPVVRTIES